MLKRAAHPSKSATHSTSLRRRKISLPSSDFKPAPVPADATLSELRAAAAKCHACPLYAHATQTVFGEGPAKAHIVFVGEQPGDSEDRAGHPFIGPAGQLLNRALTEIGIDRPSAYVTNAVKHFKWEPRGKRRLHSKPNGREITACKPWLAAELTCLRPKVLVLLGSTAVQSVLGSAARVLRDRGRCLPSEFCSQTVITVHPSSLLRAPDEAARHAAYAQFVQDLRVAQKLLAGK